MCVPLCSVQRHTTEHRGARVPVVGAAVGDPDSWVGILAGCVASSNLLNSFEPQFLHLHYRDRKRTHPPRWEMSEVLAQLLAEDKLHENRDRFPGYGGPTLSRLQGNAETPDTVRSLGTLALGYVQLLSGRWTNWK